MGGNVIKLLSDDGMLGMEFQERAIRIFSTEGNVMELISTKERLQEDIDEKEMRRLVVKELKSYKALCVRMKNQENQRRECVYELVHLYIEKLVKQGEIKEVKRSRRKR